MVKEIKNAEKLPERFYKIYETQNPNSLTYSLKKQMFMALLTSNFRKPPSSQVAVYTILLWNNNISSRNYKLREISFSWKIESQVSQRECLNFIVNKEGFLYGIKGIKKASKKYFDKKLEDLNDKELASLVLMMKNPRMYNPIRRKKILEQKVEQLLSKVK